ncbi:outer membrane protein assembly factor BamE [Candidatus Pelagibacter sp.]|nr:outer membrane protein assembly factor BamE [Candidatus Pelagibacter sp.]
MKKYFIILLLTIFIPNCSLNKVIKHHGTHFLDKKEKQLVILKSNRNDVMSNLGPPSTESYFDNEMWIYIERKTTSTKLTRLGKYELLVNNVLLLEFNDRGLLSSKKFYNKEDINDIKFDTNETGINYSKNSFLYSFFNSMRQKIDDPLGKKRKRIKD